MTLSAITLGFALNRRQHTTSADAVGLGHGVLQKGADDFPSFFVRKNFLFHCYYSISKTWKIPNRRRSNSSPTLEHIHQL